MSLFFFSIPCGTMQLPKAMKKSTIHYSFKHLSKASVSIKFETLFFQGNFNYTSVAKAVINEISSKPK